MAPAHDKIKVTTDPGGSIPSYYSIHSHSVMFGHTSLSAAPRNDLQSIDPVSVADFIINSTVCYPYSIFKDVFVVPPGSHVEITPKGLDVDTYYLPEEVQDSGTESFWGERIRETVQRVLFDGLKDASSVKVLYSGGEDARSVVSLLPVDLKCELLTFADHDNREVSLARRAARVQRPPFTFLQRPPGFYYQDIEQRVSLIGAGWDVRHTHAYGSLAEPLKEADAIIGGYGADTLFKSAWMGNVQRNKMSRLGPIEKLDPNYPDWPVGTRNAMEFSWLDRDIAAAVDERRWVHHLRLKEFRPRSAGNWHTLWPLGAHRITYPHYLACLKIGPKVVEPFLDPKLYYIAAQMPDTFRVDRRAFREAFKKSLGLAGWLPTSSGNIPALGGYVGKQVNWKINKVRRTRDSIQNKIRIRAGLDKLVQGPWGPDHHNINLQVSDVLSHRSAEALDEILKYIVKKNINTTEFINQISNAERFRAIQVGCAIS